jgi:hypothetical protein
MLFGQVQAIYAQRTATTSYGTFFFETAIMVDGTFVPGHEATPAQLATNPLLFENHTADHKPIFMPGGTTQVRYNDLANVNGTARIREVAEGTEVSVDVDGLVPGGLYSTWIDLFRAPGFTPDAAHELGVTALGYDANNPPADPQAYTGNVFRADASGHGEIVGIQPAAPFSWFATGLVPGLEVPEYLLDSPVHQAFVILSYHQDDNTWGLRPGSGEGLDAFDGTWTGYAGAGFTIPEPSSLILLGLGALGALVHWKRALGK